MCGIVAMYSPHGEVNSVKLESAIKSLEHRGPDNQNCWISEDRHVGLAHARLSIIDLHNGQQPISNNGNNCHLVANGEFYDYEKIRAELSSQGYEFKTSSDSEIALHLYQKYGVDCLRHLRGEFAFTIWDDVNQTLFAARDRFGINPLYYAQVNGNLYIGSEIKALLAAGVEAKWDADSYHSRAFYYRDRTLFDGVHQVPPGHYIVATTGGVRIQKYWDLNYPEENQHLNVSPEQAIENVRERLLESVETRLRADVPVGVYLSGGVDSCAVLGMTSHLRDQAIDTFTLSFDDDDYDEGSIARNMSNHVGSNHHEIKVTQTEIADNFMDSVKFSENLCMNSHGAAKYLLSRYVRDLGFRVVLTGEGADEVFAGYPSFRNDLLKKGELAEQTAIKETLMAKNKVSAGLHFSENETGMEFIERQLGSVPTWLPPLMHIHDKIADYYKPAQKHVSSTQAVQQFLNSLDYNQIRDIDPVHRAMYGLSKSMMANYVLVTLGDRMEMAHSLEGRVPFLDHKVVEYVTQLPIEMKIHNMTEKYVMREAVKPFIIDEVYNRQKHPFMAPPSVLDPNAKFHQLVQDTLRGQLLKDVPYFDHAKVVNFLDGLSDVPQEKWAITEAILMEMMSLTSLQSHFKLSA